MRVTDEVSCTNLSLIAAFAVLFGAKLNAEIEHQTARDSTTGRPVPMGRRGARMADTLGAAR